MNRNELSFVYQIIRTSIAGLALDATWEALQSPGWDERCLKSLQHDWEQVNLSGLHLERGLLAERACGAVWMECLRRPKTGDPQNLFGSFKSLVASPSTSNNSWSDFWMNKVPFFVYKVTGMNEDELVCLKHESDVIGGDSTRQSELAVAQKSGWSTQIWFNNWMTG